MPANRASGLSASSRQLPAVAAFLFGSALGSSHDHYILSTTQEREGDGAAISFLIEHVAGRTDLVGLERLLELYTAKLTDDAPTRAAVQVTLAVIGHLRSCRPGYQCEQCGFVAHRLHWQCSGCKRWESIKPVQPEPIGDCAGTPPIATLPDEPGYGNGKNL